MILKGIKDSTRPNPFNCHHLNISNLRISFRRSDFFYFLGRILISWKRFFFVLLERILFRWNEFLFGGTNVISWDQMFFRGEDFFRRNEFYFVSTQADVLKMSCCPLNFGITPTQQSQKPQNDKSLTVTDCPTTKNIIR